jgi:hypothetical protein
VHFQQAVVDFAYLRKALFFGKFRDRKGQGVLRVERASFPSPVLTPDDQL